MCQSAGDKDKCDMSTRTRPTISANFAKSHSGGLEREGAKGGQTNDVSKLSGPMCQLPLKKMTQHLIEIIQAKKKPKKLEIKI